MRIIEVDTLTPEQIAELLPPSWTFSFVNIEAALRFHHPDAEIR